MPTITGGPHYQILHGDTTFAATMSITPGSVGVFSDPAVGSYFTTGAFGAYEGFLSFDTSGLVATPTNVAMVLRATQPNPGAADYLVAAYNWGATAEAADWRIPTQLAALTEVGRFTFDDIIGGTFSVDIAPSAIIVGGTTRFILYEENMVAPISDPAAIWITFFNGAADTDPPILLVDVRPTVDVLTPSGGSTAGGTEVVVAGTRLADATAVAFGGDSAAFVVDSDTHITAVSPAHAAGVVQVVVTTPDGSSG